MVWRVVVIVAEALAGGVTVAGLTEHTGVEVVAWLDETWQERSTVPVKPLKGLTVIVEYDVPPGATASGEKAAFCRLKSWADAEHIRVRETMIAQKIARAARLARNFNSGFVRFKGDDSNFNMSRVSVASIPGTS